MLGCVFPEVEIRAVARCSSQLQLSPGSENVVSPLVRSPLPLFPDNRAQDFSETWYDVKGQ